MLLIFIEARREGLGLALGGGLYSVFGITSLYAWYPLFWG